MAKVSDALLINWQHNNNQTTHALAKPTTCGCIGNVLYSKKSSREEHHGWLEECAL
jgi:hypothetical protein